MEVNDYQLIKNKLEFVVVFLNSVSALQILQMTTFCLATVPLATVPLATVPLATVPFSLPGKPNCPHTTTLA